MRISCDPEKNERNIRERGLPFAWAAEFEFEHSGVRVDARREYGEVRYVAIGLLRGRLHVLCFTETPDGIRVISLRKANQREVQHHAQQQTPD
jgi:uncharacterized DUF497 family protein